MLMQRHFVILALLGALSVAVPPLGAGSNEAGGSKNHPLTVALFDFQSSDKALEKACSANSAFLYVHLSKMPGVMLVERSDVEKVLAEQSFGLSGAVSADTAARLGGMLGAKVIVTGRFLRAGSQITLMAKVIGTETGRVFAANVWALSTEGSQLESASAELAAKIADLIRAEAPHLVFTEELPAQRIARLRKLVEGKNLPPVTITVREQHLTTSVADPAVQTELAMILTELGFTVSLGESQTPDPTQITVTGEAFSELAARRGSLVSCRARVELVLKRQDGSLVMAEREMGTAVDVAENIAGKRALQNAALKLADRVVACLTNLEARRPEAAQ